MEDSAVTIPLMLLALGLFSALIQTQLDLDRLKRRLSKYESLNSKEEFEQQLDSDIYRKQSDLALLDEQKHSLSMEVESLRQQSRQLETKAYLQALDSYEPFYSFLQADDYLLQLRTNKEAQERLKSAGHAYLYNAEWTVGDSKRKGKKMIKDHLALIEVAFENQCKSAIQDVKHSNVAKLEKKITDTFEKLNRLSGVLQCEISQEYFELKRRELHLKHELEDKKQEEQERKREIQRQQLEQKRERAANEKARKALESAEQQRILRQQELDAVRLEIEQAEGEKRQQLERQIQSLEKLVSEAERDEDKARSDYAETKAGHIYVMSNIGSLGLNIYRIFMTRSNREDEYVNTMNPMVPFPFDIHFKIHSEDPGDTIQRLHSKFSDRKVNIANERRDFFKVSLDEIEEAVREIRDITGFLTICEFESEPKAIEFFKTQSAQKRQ